MAQRTASVLVAEDDESTRELIDVLFAQEPGIYYSIAAGGANAISKLSDGPPDVILTDLVMPRVSGREVIAFARKQYPGIPIIAISAEPGAARDADELVVGGELVRFLRKPLDLSHLVALIQELAAGQSWRPTDPAPPDHTAE